MSLYDEFDLWAGRDINKELGMAEELKRAAIWRQWAYFVECPYCHETNNIGEDLSPDPESENICESCHKPFIETWSQT